ncbi:MAG: branched-chain amino acid transport system II carrier protein [Clostridia bacterium]|nr:branched-chain amino acid transport system II carrier protein [Clostridia bacterium]
MKNKQRTDTLVIGFALFSMFFGAGNVIFPPYLGLQAGPQWVIAFGSYFIMDIGLAMVGVLAVVKCSTAEELLKPLGKVVSVVFFSVLTLCLGPMFAVPRTAATTYEMGFLGTSLDIGPRIFAVIFFVIVFLLSIRESAVVDIVGKVLTPVLLIGLVILIVKGIVSPLGSIVEEPKVDNIISYGVESGYQAMDAMGSLLLTLVIVSSAMQKGYTDEKSRSKVVAAAALIAGGIMFLVYLGLTYLGATVSGTYDLSITRVNLVISIVHGLLGGGGRVIIAIVIAMACLTTAIALISSASTFFASLIKKKGSYEVLVTVFCIFSCIISTMGVESILNFAAPILGIIYPPVLTLIIMGFLPRTDKVFMATRFAFAGALIASIIETAGSNLTVIPALANMGINWIVPAFILGLIGFFIPIRKNTN